jgi:hypothetical protein
MLTFCCLLTEKPTTANRPLPARRRDLYQHLVRRLLLGKWATNPVGPDAAPDLVHCQALLTEWAWHAVHNSTTPTGLGDWGDSFVQPTPPREGEHRAIDNVAPKVTEDDEGEITRRFVHRTFLEHFVAEHIASRDTDEAAQTLLPHLWFDLDWQVACPAAVAAHNQRVPGALLQRLLDQAARPAIDPPRLGPGTGFDRRVLESEFDRLLLGIAAESEPSEWTQDHQDLIHQCRRRNATSNPDAVAESADWTDSNQGVRTVLLNALRTIHPWEAGHLVRALCALKPTDDERAEARTALINASDIAHDEEFVRRLVESLLALSPTYVELAETRTVLLNALHTADVGAARDIVQVLPALEPTDAERAETRTALLNALHTAGPWDASHLIPVLSALNPTDVERAETRTALLNALHTAHDPDAAVVVRLAEALPTLSPSGAELAKARSALLNALHTAKPWTAASPAAALLPGLDRGRVAFTGDFPSHAAGRQLDADLARVVADVEVDRDVVQERADLVELVHAGASSRESCRFAGASTRPSGMPSGHAEAPRITPIRAAT